MPLTPESARKNSDAGHAAIPNHHKNGCPQNYIEPSERTDATVCDCQNDGTAGPTGEEFMKWCNHIFRWDMRLLKHICIHCGLSNTNSASKAQRLRIFERDGWKCWYCAKDIVPFSTETNTATPTTAVLDHVHPKALGGKTKDENLVAACWPCNASKREKSVEEYRQHLRYKNPQGRAIAHLEAALAENLGAIHYLTIAEIIKDLENQLPEVVFYGERKVTN